MSQLSTTDFKAYSAILVRRSNFRHQASPRVSPLESTQRRYVELWTRNVRWFCLNAELHVTFRNLLHATTWDRRLYFPLRRKACWGFFRPKYPKASAECEPANLGTKGQHTTSRPPKPLASGVKSTVIFVSISTHMSWSQDRSFHVLVNSLFINRPFIPSYIIWAIHGVDE
jgi:hypothetical protein